MLSEAEFTQKTENIKKHLLAHREQKIVITLDLPTLFVIIGNLQLALRHPGNTGYGADEIRTMCENLINLIRPGFEEVAEILELGFDPEHDTVLI